MSRTRSPRLLSLACGITAVALLDFSAVAMQPPQGNPRTTAPERTGHPNPVRRGIIGAVRIVGCVPGSGTLTFDAQRADGSGQHFTAPSHLTLIKDERGITTAYFDMLLGYTNDRFEVTVGITDSACAKGRWIRGPKMTVALSEGWPNVALLYAANERDTLMGMQNRASFLELALRVLKPQVRLHNFGPEQDGSRFAPNQSWAKYTLPGPPPETQTIVFTIPEVRIPLASGYAGVLKYYVANLESLPVKEILAPIAWDTSAYLARLQWQFEDSGIELRGYLKNVSGLTDNLAPDVDMTGPLTVTAAVAPNYSYWDGRVGLSVEDTGFEVGSLQAGGVCDLGWDACAAASEYKKKIKDAVKEALAKSLSDSKVSAYVGDTAEEMLNTTPQTAPDGTVLDGAFITRITKAGGDLTVKWVPTHLYRQPSPPPSEPGINACHVNQRCCGKRPDGSCLRCIPRGASCQ